MCICILSMTKKKNANIKFFLLTLSLKNLKEKFLFTHVYHRHCELYKVVHISRALSTFIRKRSKRASISDGFIYWEKMCTPKKVRRYNGSLKFSKIHCIDEIDIECDKRDSDDNLSVLQLYIYLGKNKNRHSQLYWHTLFFAQISLYWELYSKIAF